MVGRQQRQPSWESPSWQATEFLEFVYSDLGGLVSAIPLRQIFYISFYDDSTGYYYIEGMRHKSQIFEKFVNLWLGHKTCLEICWKDTVPTLEGNLTTSFSRPDVKKTVFSGNLLPLIPLNKTEKQRDWTILLCLLFAQFSQPGSFFSLLGLRSWRLLLTSKIGAQALMVSHFLSIWRGKNQTCAILKLCTLVLGCIFQKKRNGSWMKSPGKEFL